MNINEQERSRLRAGLFKRTDEEEWRKFERTADELVRRQATVHERVACPTCSAPAGERCRSMPRGYRQLDLQGRKDARELKHSHKQRLRADGLYER